MSESRDEAYVRRVLAVERFGAELRKIPETSVTTADFELISGGERLAVLEVKCLAQTPLTAENGWTVTSTGPSSFSATRNDNGPKRIAALIHTAWKQFAGCTV